MRFKDKFSYHIKTAPGLELDELCVPPMLIQPYIENALRHGLLPKQSDDRSLFVTFSESGGSVLQCTITDNGIGRKKASDLKEKRPLAAYKGIGTSNPKERLAILNQLYAGKISVQIQDLYGKQNQPVGTKVLINMPMDV